MPARQGGNVSSTLLDRLVSKHGCSVVNAQAVDAFIGGGDPADRVLFFTGDPVRRPEAHDVAAVLPELFALFPNRFQLALVAREDESALKARFGVMLEPSLVFLRHGAFIGVIAKILDWPEFVRRVAALLDAPATEVVP